MTKSLIDKEFVRVFFMELLTDFQFKIIFQLLLAVFLGALIGIEREYNRKDAGIRTYSLLALGTTLLTLITFSLLEFSMGKPGMGFDLSRIIQAIAVGIGFIGAGVIFRQPSGIIGLTTAAGIWTTAAIGVAVGAGLYFLAIAATILTLLVMVGFGFVERKFFKG